MSGFIISKAPPRLFKIPPWLMITPFGFPPVPEVYIIQAGEVLFNLLLYILSSSNKSLLIIVLKSKYLFLSNWSRFSVTLLISSNVTIRLINFFSLIVLFNS